LAASSSSGTLQTLDYKYHIRNYLIGINLNAAGNPSIANGKLFSMKLGYEETGYYDGNIGKQEWLSSIDNLSRSYTYSYDKANRILGASYAGGKPNENYGLNSVTYDVNGNIKTLSRNGLRTNNTFGVVDNLVYTYQANSNKIQKVDDSSAETASFTDATGSTDYTYSADGSLISDANKGISVIEYNYLKLPKRIVKGGVNILYQYDASGRKLKETIATQVTDYVGNKIYKNGVLYQISHDEGRIANGIYEYGINDHLGNVRVMFRDSSGIAKPTQVENFGVWGESLTGINYYRNTTNKQNFVYTGHEKLEELGVFDAKARVYDPITPRFWQQDILADKFRKYSPYNYSLNNPLRFIDPTGMEVISVAGGVQFTGEDAVNAFSILKGQKRNIYIDLTSDPQEQSATKNKNYSNWAVFAVSSFGLAKDVLSIFGSKTFKNMVIEAHGIKRERKDGTFFDTYIKADEKNGNTKITANLIRDFNAGDLGESAEYSQIEALQNIMSKVEDSGNCILAICNIGVTGNNMNTEYASALSSLSGNRFWMYTVSGFSNANTNKNNPDIFATMIKGGLSNDSSVYWNKIFGGKIISTLKDIILQDSNKPVEFK
jgi:RHS repeat-associated protein